MLIKKWKKRNLSEEYAGTLITGIWDNCEILPDQETAMQGIKITLEPIIINKTRQ